MGGNSREGQSPILSYGFSSHDPTKIRVTDHVMSPGGKAKPLKAPKKEKKELDEEELAFREKQKTGTLVRIPNIVTELPGS